MSLVARPRCRKLTVLDALILVAAVAVGLAGARHFMPSEAGGESYPNSLEVDPRTAFRHGLEVFNGWLACSAYVLAPVTVALAALRIWATPRLRRLARRPGAVACGAVALTVGWDLARSAVYVLIGLASGRPYEGFWQFTCLLVSGENAGLAIASAWGLLLASGRWRREPGWLDGGGIALGAFWVSQALLAQLLGSLYYYL